MKPGPRTRRALLFGALALTLAAVRWVSDDAEDTSGATAAARHPVRAASQAAPAREGTTPPAPGPQSPVRDPAQARHDAKPLGADAFPARDWAPPPRRPTPAEIRASAPPPPPPPMAPPLPYTYVGMLGEGDSVTVFLTGRGQDHAVKRGDVIEGTWRVDEVRPDRVVFTYLPLNQSTTLDTGPR